jgi:hypothetical protein
MKFECVWVESDILHNYETGCGKEWINFNIDIVFCPFCGGRLKLITKRDGKRPCPWPDYEGNEIYEGDIITHPVSKETGVVVFRDNGKRLTDKWYVRYFDGSGELKLILQIGEKGQATVTKR